MWIAVAAIGLFAAILAVGIGAWVQVLSEKNDDPACPRCRRPLTWRASKAATGHSFQCPICGERNQPRLSNPAGWLRGQLRPPE